MSEAGNALLQEMIGNHHGSAGRSAGLRLAGGIDRIEGKVPCARDGHSCVVHDGLMYIFGGDKCSRKLHDLFMYKL